MINKKLPYESKRFKIKILKNNSEIKNPLNGLRPLEERFFFNLHKFRYCHEILVSFNDDIIWAKRDYLLLDIPF